MVQSKQTITLSKYAKEKKEIESIIQTKDIITKHIDRNGVENWFIKSHETKFENRVLWILPCPDIKELKDVIDGYVDEVNKLIPVDDYLIIVGETDIFQQKINCKNVITRAAGDLSDLLFRTQTAKDVTNASIEIFNSKVVTEVRVISIEDTNMSWTNEKILPFSGKDDNLSNLDIKYNPGFPKFSLIALKNYITSVCLQSIAKIYLYELKSKLAIYQTSLQRIEELKVETTLQGFKKRQEKVTLEIQGIVTAHKVLSDED